MKKILITLLATLFLAPAAFAIEADADLMLTKVSQSDTELTVNISVSNPSNQMVKSVQSWLKYDPSVLKGKAINTTESPFDFVAPGENNFDHTQGIVKIGRSTLSQGSSDTKVYVADVTFEILKSTSTQISFYNFQVGNESNTSVRVFEDGFPVNILGQAPQALAITTHGGNQTSTPVDSTDYGASVIQEPEEQELNRPLGLRVTSGPEYAVLAWNKDSNVRGYNIYYSTNSGRYLQRRSVGNVNEYYLDGLETGKYYYFAITAYDNENEETDYSNEVRIKVGFPDSSSNPLTFTTSDKVIQNTKTHVQSGPAEMLILLTVIAGAGAFIIGRRRKI